MKIEVRYYSRSGNTKILGERIAKALNTKAISVDDKDAIINKNIDYL